MKSKSNKGVARKGTKIERECKNTMQIIESNCKGKPLSDAEVSRRTNALMNWKQ